jgi:hypothetical protein
VWEGAGPDGRSDRGRCERLADDSAGYRTIAPSVGEHSEFAAYVRDSSRCRTAVRVRPSGRTAEVRSFRGREKAVIALARADSATRFVGFNRVQPGGRPASRRCSVRNVRRPPHP